MVESKTNSNYLKLYNKFENLPGKRVEVIVLIFYVLSTSIVTVFHEPWFDEAQSWMIARSASLYDILFTIPHYEGHPPLWHLILLPFAKSGVPYEIGLKSVSIVICATAMGLLIFKSPFPRIIRVTLPFTYFFFYQYSVISRCYTLMMLGFVLAALTYKNKDIKPFRFVISLMLICASSAYGIVLCGGIAIAWLIEIWNTKKQEAFLKVVFKERRFYALFTLLVFAILLICLIIPRSDAYAIVNNDFKNSFLFRLTYMLFILPAESSVYQSFFEYNGLPFMTFSALEIIPGLFIGIIMIFLMIMVSIRYRKILLLIIPYILFSVFSAYVYFFPHHIGIPILFFTFWAWICMEEYSRRIYPNPKLTKNKILIINAEAVLRKLMIFLVSLSICISLYWSVVATVNEVNYNHSLGRSISKFIDKYNLTNYKIIVPFSVRRESDNVYTINTNHFNHSGVETLPYYDNNIFYNLNNGLDDKGYLLHIKATKDDNEANIKKWREYGLPDVMLGKCALNYIFSKEELSKVRYIPVYEVSKSHLWKDNSFDIHYYIYLRSDLAGELSLEEIEFK